MVSLAWAVCAAGHEVRYVTAGPALAVKHAGLPVIDAAPQVDIVAMARKRITQHQEDRQLIAAMRDLRDMAPFLAKFSEIIVDGAVEAAAEWQPELVVHAQTDGAGLLVAAKLGVPLVTHGLGILRGAGTHELLHAHMADAFARYGVTTLPEHIASIDVAPPSMLAGDPSGWSMRYVPYNGGCVLPKWLRTPVERPRITVTLGTIVPALEGLGPVQRMLEIAGSVDAEFVLALGNVDTRELGELPGNTRVVGWVPLDERLRGCAALVHHGGEGTTMTALAAGVPQLILPSGVGRHAAAAAVQQRGAGLSAQVQDVDAALLARLLEDEALAKTATQVRAEIAALPTPANLVPRLVNLANAA